MIGAQILARVNKAINTYLVPLLADTGTLKTDVNAIQAAMPSSSDYTSDRATKIDNLDATVTSRLGSIKSIRRGAITCSSTSASATLNPPVNVDKTILIPLGYTISYSSVNADDYFIRYELTSTSVNIIRIGPGATVVASYQVIEFN